MTRSRDTGLSALLFVGTLTYLSGWPHDFIGFDEGMYLYEAKRVLQGDVMYRDFFQILTPAWFYLMACLYAVFGVSFETARASMAVVHGLIGMVTFLLCHQVGVRPVLAFLVAATHLTLGYPANTMATPHWLSTLLIVTLLLVVVRQPAASSARAFAWGAIAGAIILVQQQKGLAMAAAGGLVVVLDSLGTGGRDSWRRLLRTVAAYAAALLTVVGPVLLAFVATAGFDNVYRALVQHPLINYRRMAEGIPWWTWGAYLPALTPFGFIIKYLPAVIVVSVAWAAWQWRRVGGYAPLRRLVVLSTFSLFALWSVLYLPDHLHFAYVAPVWFALAATMVEGLLETTPLRAAAATVGTYVLAVLLIAAMCWQLQRSRAQRREWWPESMQTEFGRIDVQEHFLAQYAWLRDLFQTTGVKDVFVYPCDPGLYLLTGTRNATRFQILLPGYQDRDQIEEVVEALEKRRVRLVIRNFYWGMNQLEPLTSYLKEHYELVRPPASVNPLVLAVWRRKAEPAAGALFH